MIVPSSVTMIGPFAFHGCSSLERVEIPSSVIALECNAFDGCSQLKEKSISSQTYELPPFAFFDDFDITQFFLNAKVQVHNAVKKNTGEKLSLHTFPAGKISFCSL